MEYSSLFSRSATQMSSLIRSGEVSCLEVVDAHIEHIENVNPTINAIVTESFDHSRKVAEHLDSEGFKGQPLFGLPVAHKDLVSTKGVRTTYGFPPYADHVPNEDAWIVTRMKAAGAIMVGKTNTPEFGAGSHTFNRLFGATRNPYDLSRTVGGSSGGAAAALRTGMVPIADGSDTGGSLRNPAAFCNVVGFRPSPGRVLSGSNGTSWTELSQQGPMARTVDDVALLFSVLAGPDPRSSRGLETSGSYFAEIQPTELANLRIGYSPDFGGLPIERGIVETLDNFARLLEREGCFVTTFTPKLNVAKRIFHVLRGMAFRNRFGSMSSSDAQQLKDTIHWNIEQGNRLTLEDLEWAIKARNQLTVEVANYFSNFDVWIGPVTQVMPFPIEVDWVRNIEGVAMENYIEWMEACSWISVLGLPCLSLPAGFYEGLPVGVQVIAPHREDLFLLRTAKAMEQVSNFQSRIPEMLKVKW